MQVEEGMTIRFKRTRKYKGKNRILIVSVQLFSIVYLLLMFGSYQVSGTNAYFIDIERTSNTISICANYDPTIGCNEEQTIWDKSSLSFTSEAFEEKKIQAVIQNGQNSEDMRGTTKYELFYISKGNPKNGQLVEEGEIPALKAGETFTIVADAIRGEGNYIFKAYQRPEHPGKGELWSEQLTVTIESSNGTSIEDSTEKQELKSLDANPPTTDQTKMQIEIEEINEKEEGKETNEQSENENDPLKNDKIPPIVEGNVEEIQSEPIEPIEDIKEETNVENDKEASSTEGH